MGRTLKTIALVAGSMVATSCLNFSGRESFAEHHPQKEDTYTITSVIQVLEPVNPADMNDDFQEARVLSRDKNSCTVEVTYYLPLSDSPGRGTTNAERVAPVIQTIPNRSVKCHDANLKIEFSAKTTKATNAIIIKAGISIMC
jgi:hypothetical protein